MTPEPKLVEVEVVQEPPPPGRHMKDASSSRPGGPPIHPLAALLLVAVDNLWMIPEFAVINWVITIPLCFITVFLPTLMIQKLVKKQAPGPALGYALLLAGLAAVPTSVLGTPFGAALLAWFGISRLWTGNRTPRDRSSGPA